MGISQAMRPQISPQPSARGLTGRGYASASIIILILVYLKIHLSITGFGVPYFYAFVVSLYVAVMSVGISAIFSACYAFFLYLVAQYFFSSFHIFHPGKADIQYILYWMTNLVTIFSLCVSLKRSDVGRLDMWIRVLLYALIVIAFLEVYGGVKPFIDSVRKLYTSTSSFYDAADRDVRQYGRIRPTAFASEPSSLGNFFGALWLLYVFWRGASISRWVESGAMMIVAVFLFRTPTLFAYLVVAALLLVYSNRQVRGIAMPLAALLVCLVAVLPYAAYSARYDLENKSMREFVSTGSFFIRNITPINTFFDMIEERPLFGFGGGYLDAAQAGNIGEIYSRFRGFYTYDRISSMPSSTFITNSFWEFFIVNGFVGSLILGWLYRRMFLRFGVKNFMLLAMLSMALWTSHAGLILTFTWVPVVVLVVILSRMDDPSATAGRQ